MKHVYRIIALALALSLALLGGGAVFALEEAVPISAPLAPADVQGTRYEEAVASLISLGVIAGYEDGSFRPQLQITRAEMAAIAVRAIDAAPLSDFKDPGFKDTVGHWAKGSIDMAYNRGLVAGMSAELFMPQAPVTYAQAITMILRAAGYPDADLGGSWPDNYLAKAKALGLTDVLDSWQAEAPANRGDIALLTADRIKSIRDHWAEQEETEEPGKGDNPLADFSGRAIGLPLEVAIKLSAKGETVDEVTFLLGDKLLRLETKKQGTVTEADFKPGGIFTGELYALRMSGGIVTGIEPAASASLKRYEELTDNSSDTDFRRITEHKNQRIKATDDGTPTAVLFDFAYAHKDDVKCYEAVFKGNDLETFRSVSPGAIDAGDYVRAWDLDGDYAGVAVVLVLIDKDDLAAAGRYGIL